MLREYFVGGGEIRLPVCSFHAQRLSAVSENDLVYNLRCELTGTTLHIIKKSEAGAEFKEWIDQKENQNDERVERKAISYMLPLLSVDDFLTIINRERELSFENGYSEAQYNIRSALGF